MPDLVNCAQLAEERAVLECGYELGTLHRVKDLLADPRGSVSARFAFEKLSMGGLGARVTVTGVLSLVCQRCMQDFELPVSGDSEIEFATHDESRSVHSEREIFRMDNGLVSLRELAEEELLLALPIAPACSAPMICGRVSGYATGAATSRAADEGRLPFSALQDLLKKP